MDPQLTEPQLTEPPDAPDVDAIRAQLRAGTAYTRFHIHHEAWYWPHLPPSDRVRALDIGIDQLKPDGHPDGTLGDWQLTFHGSNLRLTIDAWAWPAFVACGFARILGDAHRSRPVEVVRWLQIAGYRDVTDRKGPHA